VAALTTGLLRYSQKILVHSIMLLTLAVLVAKTREQLQFAQ
jgi:hypothetical protein